MSKIQPKPSDVPPSARARDYYECTFDLEGFLAETGNVRLVDVARDLGVSRPTTSAWKHSKRVPLSVYKAVIVKYAPMARARYDAQLKVSRKTMPSLLPKRIIELAARYDDTGAHSPPAETQTPAPPQLAPDPLPSSLTAELDVLLALLTRVVDERNRLAVQLSQATLRSESLEATIRSQAEQLVALRKDVEEWQQLAEHSTGSLSGPTSATIADEVVQRLGKLFVQRGATTLAAELEKITGKSLGHLA